MDFGVGGGDGRENTLEEVTFGLYVPNTVCSGPGIAISLELHLTRITVSMQFCPFHSLKQSESTP